MQKNVGVTESSDMQSNGPGNWRTGNKLRSSTFNLVSMHSHIKTMSNSAIFLMFSRWPRLYNFGAPVN